MKCIYIDTPTYVIVCFKVQYKRYYGIIVMAMLMLMRVVGVAWCCWWWLCQVRQDPDPYDVEIVSVLLGDKLKIDLYFFGINFGSYNLFKNYILYICKPI